MAKTEEFDYKTIKDLCSIKGTMDKDSRQKVKWRKYVLCLKPTKM